MATHSQISLDEVEQELKQLLVDVAKHINPDKPSQLRFTGGWVRDKLLGVGSHDVDVAIDDMTGYQFGLRMKDYLDLPGNAERYGIKEMTADDQKSSNDARHVVRGLHKIEANPEKSKHLETVTTKIFGLDIDLVNLRKETYTEDSRNPQMEFGTPEEDALRRDATINALFYNLQSSEVEDLTGRGLDDMAKGIIRTPLEPYQTFKDDPLRVLRLIRFTSRLGYELDPEAKKAMQDESIKQALQAKISRERVNVEFDKMLRGPRPLMALELIDRFGLYQTIFSDPEKEHGYQPEVDKWPTAYQVAEAIVHDRESSLSLLFEDEPEQAYLVRMLSAAVPWFDAPLPEPPRPNSKAPPPVGVEVFRNGIKATNKVCEVVWKSLLNASSIIDAKRAFIEHTQVNKKPAENGTPAGRDTIGMLVRNWGPTWRSQCAFAIMLELTQSQRSTQDVLKSYASLLSHIRTLDLSRTYALKPIIDGKALSAALDTPPGPWMKSALETVIAWQLANPSENAPDAAVAHLRAHSGELPDALLSHILSLTVRPLFAQTRSQSNANLTPQARRAVQVPTRQRGSVGLETFAEAEASRPWKQEREAHALRLLAWCVAALRADRRRAETHWALLVPPLLTLVDDVDVRFKTLGCRLLHGLFEGTEPAFLKRTGLADEFHSAIAPCLSYLPSLTPQSESVQILSQAYPALVALARVRYPESQTTEETGFNEDREAYLAEILHKHLIPAFTHVTADSHPELMTTLLEQLDLFCNSLGSGTIGHLQHVVPLINEVLTTPFGTAAPKMLAQAARTMSSIVVHAAPRMWRWRAEICGGLCRAWVAIADDITDTNNASVRKKLEEPQSVIAEAIARLRDAVVNPQPASLHVEVREGERAAVEEAASTFDADLCGLVDADARLKDLLQPLSVQ